MRRTTPARSRIYFDAVAPHASRRLHHRPKCVHRALGLALLTETHDRVEHRQQDQQNPGAPLLDDQRHHSRNHKDDLHVAAVLIQEAPPTRPGLLLRQRIRPVDPQQLGRRRRRQPGRDVNAQRRRNVLCRTRIPPVVERLGVVVVLVCMSIVRSPFLASKRVLALRTRPLTLRHTCRVDPSPAERVDGSPTSRDVEQFDAADARRQGGIDDEVLAGRF